MEKIGNNDKKIETKKQAPSIRVNKLYSICSAAYMFAAVVICLVQALVALNSRPG